MINTMGIEKKNEEARRKTEECGNTLGQLRPTAAACHTVK